MIADSPDGMRLWTDGSVNKGWRENNGDSNILWYSCPSLAPSLSLIRALASLQQPTHCTNSPKLLVCRVQCLQAKGLRWSLVRLSPTRSRPSVRHGGHDSFFSDWCPETEPFWQPLFFFPFVEAFIEMYQSQYGHAYLRVLWCSDTSITYLCDTILYKLGVCCCANE